MLRIHLSNDETKDFLHIRQLPPAFSSAGPVCDLEISILDPTQLAIPRSQPDDTFYLQDGIYVT